MLRKAFPRSLGNGSRAGSGNKWRAQALKQDPRFAKNGAAKHRPRAQSLLGGFDGEFQQVRPPPNDTMGNGRYTPGEPRPILRVRRSDASRPMDQISTNQALTMFAKWERENKSIALFLSTPSVSITFRDGNFTPFTDDCLVLSFAGDNVLRIFLSEAAFWRLKPKEIRRDISETIPDIEECVRILSEKPTMQCFLYASTPHVRVR